MNVKLFAMCSFVAVSNCFAVDPGWSDSEWRSFYDALRQTETGAEPNEGLGAVGDNGNAIGPYQIWDAYYADAKQYDSGIGGVYEDVKNDKALSERVVKAYICRYLPKNGSMEDAARIHNGGPKGHKKKSTLGYLKKFKKFLLGT
jgi:hypothetical protein